MGRSTYTNMNSVLDANEDGILSPGSDVAPVRPHRKRGKNERMVLPFYYRYGGGPCISDTCCFQDV